MPRRICRVRTTCATNAQRHVTRPVQQRVLLHSGCQGTHGCTRSCARTVRSTQKAGSTRARCETTFEWRMSHGLSHLERRMLHVTCRTSHAARRMPHVACHCVHLRRSMRSTRGRCNMQNATCNKRATLCPANNVQARCPQQRTRNVLAH